MDGVALNALRTDVETTEEQNKIQLHQLLFTKYFTLHYYTEKQAGIAIGAKRRITDP